MEGNEVAWGRTKLNYDSKRIALIAEEEIPVTPLKVTKLGQIGFQRRYEFTIPNSNCLPNGSIICITIDSKDGSGNRVQREASAYLF